MYILTGASHQCLMSAIRSLTVSDLKKFIINRPIDDWRASIEYQNLDSSTVITDIRYQPSNHRSNN